MERPFFVVKMAGLPERGKMENFVWTRVKQTPVITYREREKQEDKKAIREIYMDLSLKACNVLELVSQSQWVKSIGIKLKRKQMRRRINQCSYYGIREVCIALSAFFLNNYSLMQLAKALYFMDEDDIHRETIDAEVPLGQVLNGISMEETSCAEIAIRKNPDGKEDEVTGLPFTITEVNLVLKDE